MELVEGISIAIGGELLKDVRFAGDQGGSRISGVDTSSADMKPVVCNWQKMVVEDRTLFYKLNIHEMVGHI